jgi:CRP/FNR family transcriptional regulator
MEKKFHPSSCTVSNFRTNKDGFCHCFEALTEEEIMMLEETKLEVSYKKGEIVCKQGTFASHVLYICSGLVKVYLEEGNDILTLKIVPSNNIIGLTSLNKDNQIFPYSVKAYQDTVVRLFDIVTFRKIVRQNALFASEVIDFLCENKIQINSRFFSFQHKQSYGRMADILLCLSNRIFKQKEFELNISRQELADLTGLSRERVIRIIKTFKDEELIGVSGKNINIIDEKGLENISLTG